ncbi:Uu.00g143960.m01.CDS01 [Anthostomella pinea]|uniref:Uu.00g143960.m01.CDS01 n=1 Tax=Anthostomella pinea TaxID=933095 RepID=A0AAI8VK93_9PEZI|nr:Uu.00g143960.m01.CDS01 [Anthostomella pinea]
MTSPHPLSAAALFSLKDWVAVVTGGGTGVGLMIAQTLAANGAKVYITGRRAAVLETSARVHGSAERLGPVGGSMVPLVMDVTSKDSIRAVVAEIGEREGAVNLLVNNAGVWRSRPTAKPEDGPQAFGDAMFEEEMEENWQQCEYAADAVWLWTAFLANATSPYFVTAAFLPLLAKAKEGPTGRVGSVINNTSVSAFLRMTQNCQYSYNASKAAATHLTRQMAYDLSHESINVRVNGLALGYFPSEMTTQASNEENESAYAAERFQQMMAGFGAPTVKRMGSPQDIAGAVLMIATNDFMWGTITILDGGFALNVPANM